MPRVVDLGGVPFALPAERTALDALAEAFGAFRGLIPTLYPLGTLFRLASRVVGPGDPFRQRPTVRAGGAPSILLGLPAFGAGRVTTDPGVAEPPGARIPSLVPRAIVTTPFQARPNEPIRAPRRELPALGAAFRDPFTVSVLTGGRLTLRGGGLAGVGSPAGFVTESPLEARARRRRERSFHRALRGRRDRLPGLRALRASDVVTAFEEGLSDLAPLRSPFPQVA